jgi:hypothetical protein
MGMGLKKSIKSSTYKTLRKPRGRQKVVPNEGLEGWTESAL